VIAKLSSLFFLSGHFFNVSFGSERFVL